jgi:AcrR family transcriptional regulator
MSAEPDPRLARTRGRVLAATVDLLAERGYAALNVEAVAERSGVAKSTIYRHWPGLSGIVLDAFSATHPEPAPIVSTGSLRADLRRFLGGLAEDMRTAQWTRLMASLVDAAERDEQLALIARDFVEQRRRRLRDLLRSAVDRGEIARDVDPDLLAGVLGGTLFYRRLISREPLGDDVVEFLVDLVAPRTR